MPITRKTPFELSKLTIDRSPQTKAAGLTGNYTDILIVTLLSTSLYFVAEPVVMKQLNQGLNESKVIEALSEKEQQVLKLVAGGFSNKEIASSIFLAEGTIKNHVSTILSKLNTRDRTRAVLIALNQGLI
jgi:DNA-binding NarL/FixJ family response regulator